MKIAIKTGRWFYATAIIVYGVQQFIYSDFRNVLFPAWQSSLPLLPVLAYLFGVWLIAAGLAILFDKRARSVSLILGGIFLVFFCLAHIPYELISEPNKPYHFALWTSALKELAFSGGAFVIASTFSESAGGVQQRRGINLLLQKLMPFGSIFFCITMISFGIMHFMYAEHVSTMVPNFMPDHFFWTYFAAIALIGSGTCIILNIRRRLVSILLSVMLFLWVLMVHAPGAMDNPMGDRGNALASTFDALLFCGVALVIAFDLRERALDNI